MWLVCFREQVGNRLSTEACQDNPLRRRSGGKHIESRTIDEMLVNNDPLIAALRMEQFSQRQSLDGNGSARIEREPAIGLRHTPCVSLQRSMSLRSTPKIDCLTAGEGGTVRFKRKSLTASHNVKRELADNGCGCWVHGVRTLMSSEM